MFREFTSPGHGKRWWLWYWQIKQAQVSVQACRCRVQLTEGRQSPQEFPRSTAPPSSTTLMAGRPKLKQKYAETLNVKLQRRHRHCTQVGVSSWKPGGHSANAKMWSNSPPWQPAPVCRNQRNVGREEAPRCLSSKPTHLQRGRCGRNPP